MKFGEKLRLLRQENNLTQPELAEKLEIEQSWLSKIETEARHPSSELLHKIAITFSLTLEQLLTGLDDHYLENNLVSVPEVRSYLHAKNEGALRYRKYGIISSSAASLLGSIILVLGLLGLIFPNQLYEYVSNGILFDGEPHDMFENSEESIRKLGLTNTSQSAIDSDQSSSVGTRILENIGLAAPVPEEQNLDVWGGLRTIVDLEEQKQEYLRKIVARESPTVELTHAYRGQSYTESVEVPEDALDIFGNAPIQNSGIRVYRQILINYDTRRENRILQILGIILIFGGVAGYFIDYRLSRLHKKTK